MNDAGPKSVKEAELLDLRQLKFFGSKALCRFSILDKACVSPSQEAYAAKANGLGWCDCEFARLKRTHVSSKLHQQENTERQLGLRPGEKKSLPLLAILRSMKLNLHFRTVTGVLYIMVSTVGRSQQFFSVHPSLRPLEKPQVPYNIEHLKGSVSQVQQLAHCWGDMLGGAANKAM